MAKKSEPLGPNSPTVHKATGRHLFTNGEQYRYMGDLEAAQQPTVQLRPGQKDPVRLSPWVKVSEQKLVDVKADQQDQDQAQQSAGLVPVHAQLASIKQASTEAEVDEIVKDDKRPEVNRAANIRRTELKSSATTK